MPHTPNTPLDLIDIEHIQTMTMHFYDGLLTYDEWRWFTSDLPTPEVQRAMLEEYLQRIEGRQAARWSEEQ